MNFTYKLEKKILLITVSGDLLGLDGERSLIEIVKSAMFGGLRYCMIDVSGIRYMNSMGLSMLVKILVLLDEQQAELFVVNPNQQVRRLFTITKLDLIFTVTDSVEIARQKIAADLYKK